MSNLDQKISYFSDLYKEVHNVRPHFVPENLDDSIDNLHDLLNQRARDVAILSSEYLQKAQEAYYLHQYGGAKILNNPFSKLK
jgi:hypothetical protein